MNPKSPVRIFIPATWPHLSAALLMALGSTARGGDILRGGGAPAAPARSSASGSEAGGVQADQARVNAQDALARTTQAIMSVKSMQDTARAAAAQLNSAAAGLPTVPNGLGAGGLQVAPGAATNPALWSGANQPVASTRTTSAGTTQVVTVKQTAQQALLNWESFNVGRSTELYFDQTSGGANRNQWIAFNTVNDPSGVPSQILGSIKAEGQVYVINQNGIIFGGASQVNTHSLVASSLPLNENLVSRGLLNNPDSQFLFSSLAQPAGRNGTPAMTPAAGFAPGGRIGDVTVQAGARLTSPTSADKVGGRIALIGPNVTNSGTIETPDGQTILAAGLQVGMAGHDSGDPTLRGLDVYVGAVTDPASVIPSYAGSAVNSGLISALRANVTMTGKDVTNNGAIDSSTSVSLNGRIDLKASYDAVSVNGADSQVPFLLRQSGSVTLGPGSAARILPERDSTEKAVGTKLALTSQVNMEGRAVHFAENATLVAPNANVNINAGSWVYFGNDTPPTSRFVQQNGQIYLDRGAILSAAGSTDVSVPLSQNFVTAELRSSELADSPLLRNGALRGQKVVVDIRQTGTYNGRTWVGSPLADVSGYAGLVERGAGELTVSGGTVKLSAGSSVVLQQGAQVDVSDGWINYTGNSVAATRLLSNGDIIDISQATPDRIYDGIFTGNAVSFSSQWGITSTWSNALAPTGRRYEQGGLFGGAAGSLTITSPSMALDGSLYGITVAGPRQRTLLPKISELNLNFQREELAVPHFAESPTPPTVTIGTGSPLSIAAPFALDASGNVPALASDRLAQVILKPELMTTGGFGALRVNNGDGNIAVPAGVNLTAPAQGIVSLSGANVIVAGNISVPGGTINLTAYTISPFEAAKFNSTSSRPAPGAGRGTVTVAGGSTLSTAGLRIDDRLFADDPLGSQLVTNAGAINLSGYNTTLQQGSKLDVSGGVAVNPAGRLSYGNGGAISIRAGQDPGVDAVTGGSLLLGATLSGYSGARGGTLAVTAPAIQVGGTAPGGEVLHLAPSFFSTGGFTGYTMTGTGLATSTAGQYVPGVLIAPGTQINPVAQNWLALTYGTNGGLDLTTITQQEGVRTPVNLSFSATGVRDSFNSGRQQVRGDFIMGEGASITTDARASVTLRGESTTLLGSVYAPGGTINVAGGTNSQSVFEGGGARTDVSLTTLHAGPRSVLSTAGSVVLTPDLRGFRTGTVLNGGTVSLSGNIAAEAGALIDVSGASGELDVAPGYLGSSYTANNTLQGSERVRTRVDSHAGTINLTGGQHLFMDATLRGHSGGPGTQGGTLNLASGRFVVGPVASALFPTIQVVQSGYTIPAGGIGPGLPVNSAGGTALQGMGYFTADSFNGSGLSGLTLAGTVQFKGDVSLTAGRTMSVATSGVLFADGAVNLTAPHVALGQRFAAPKLPEELVTYSPFVDGNIPLYIQPVTGSGSLTVQAKHIDVGNLTLQGIGNARLVADAGDIRGNGTFDIAGNLTLRAGQIYPATATTFMLSATDYLNGASISQGTVRIESSGTRQLPLSAGGTLNIFASVIEQGGVLRAPVGTINLGWDGTGTAPRNPLTNQAVASTGLLTLTAGSVTSVSALDPVTGKAVTLPYGTNLSGTAWIDPSGLDITRTGPPSKGVNLSGRDVDVQSGSTLDIRGGGDLYAYRWVPGNGGTRDVLASSGSFAVIPGYDSSYAPWANFNSSTLATSLNGDAGYVNSSLTPGDRVYLNGSEGLPAGSYTLLPARYALLPGAFLVTPKAAAPGGTISQPDKSSLVAGYRFNESNPGGQNVLMSSFEVAPVTVVRQRAQYDNFTATAFFREVAANSDTPPPRLPVDGGQLVLTAAQNLAFSGSLTALAPTGGKGGLVDISSPLDIVITGAGSAAAPGKLTLRSADLSSFNAQSLLIGGVRRSGFGGTSVSVKTGSITVDNAGAPLTGEDIILVSNGSLTVKEGSVISQNGTGSVDSLLFGDAALPGSGNGTLLRLSGDRDARVTRRGITAADGPALSIAANVELRGNSLTLDSTAATLLDPSARLRSGAISLNSGRITLALDGAGPLPADSGLILTGGALDDLQSAQTLSRLSFLSYSSLDIFGTGQVGQAAAQSLELHAAQIRGFNNAGGTVTFAAQNILIDNSAAGAVPGAVSPASGNLVFDGNVIRLGANDVRMDQFDSVTLRGRGGVETSNHGSLSISGNARIETSVLTGASAADHAIRAGGSLDLVSLSGSSTLTPGLGARLSLSGQSVSSTTRIALPSGEVTLQSGSGQLTAGGTIDVSGTSRNYFDLTKFTDGGRITLGSTSGNVIVAAGSTLSVRAPGGGGSAGKLTIDAPGGTVAILGTLDGRAGTGGRSGSASITASTIQELGGLDALLNDAHFNESRSYRALTGDIAVNGPAKSLNYSVAADGGSIAVSNVIDASGTTGGAISLKATGSVVLEANARLSTAAAKFNAAGKGGTIALEAGAQKNGAINPSVLLDIKSGSAMDLSVAASAVAGQAAGTLHLRAPQTAAGTELQMAPVQGTITGASSIVVEGYKLYGLTGSGTINAAVQNSVKAGSTLFGDAGTGILNRVLSGPNAALQSIAEVYPGAELYNLNGDLTLASTWDLSTFRFGPQNVPGVLTLRASGNLNFNFASSLSDGFGGGAGQLWQQPLLAAGTKSWSYRLTAGADLGAADYQAVQALDTLAGDKGSLILGSNGTGTMALPTAYVNVIRDGIITPRYQTIRTGTGDITISAGRDVQILNPLGTIYTAGTQAAPMADFDTPDVTYAANTQSPLGISQAGSNPYPAQYSLSGGNVMIQAQNDIARYRVTGSGANAQLVADSTRQMPTNWLYRRGYVDPATGEFAATRAGRDTGSTSWWVDFSNFYEGIGALGGGNITLTAGRDVANVDALIPTNARMPKGTPNAGALLELGGGDLTVSSGRNIDGGVYYVERGTGTIKAGGDIKTNSTRAAMSQGQVANLQFQGRTPDATSWLPTTLFAGKSTFDVFAGGSVRLGQVANTFLLPQGINNSYHQKTYFSTYSQTAGVNVGSLTGDLTLQSNPSGESPGTLFAWYNNVLRYSTVDEPYSRSQPWLKLAETDVTPFSTAAALMPGTLKATAFSGSINLAGNLTLSPAATGTIEFAAAGAVNGLQPNSLDSLTGSYQWGSSTINLSDADPALLPRITAPLTLSGQSVGTAWLRTPLTALDTLNSRFLESGSTTGIYAVLQTRQALHAAGLLHAADTEPVRIYAGSGNVSGLTLFSGKAGRIFAGGDITDISLYMQNVRDSDITVVSSGRDIVAYNPNSPLRTLAQTAGNLLLDTPAGKPTAGDLQISGPGTIEVLAGRNLDLGVGPNNSDRTALGLVSIGNARNPALPFEGADIVAAAGLGGAEGLTNPNIDFAAFIDKYVTAPTVIGTDSHYYLAELLGGLSYEEFKKLSADQQQALADSKKAEFNALDADQQKLVAINVFYRVLRDTGRARSKTANYDVGEDAVKTLFKGDTWNGDMSLTARAIKTQSGGNISLLAPGGKLTVGLDATGNQALDQGIFTESGGTISIFTHESVAVGTSRIFTLRGGDEVIWSSTGDIAAGASSKTVQSAPPTRVLIDPQSADVKTDLAGLATGGGIGVLATVAGVAAGNVDLIAPKGTIDAGDAGIRVTGNINISAPNVVNGGNIDAGGTSSGAPSAPSSGAGGVTSTPPPAAPSRNDNAGSMGEATKPRATTPAAEAPVSVITVEVTGYGGGTSESEDDKDRERRRKQEEEAAKKESEAAGQ